MQLLLWLLLAPAVFRPHGVRHPPAERILWIGAHPDDEVLIAPILGRSCAPDLCSLLVFTHGERGDCVLPGGCGNDLGAVRAAEMARAASLFGASLTLWSLSDVGIDRESVESTWSSEAGGREALIARIQTVISADAPAVIYTFDPNHGSTCHAAHRALGALVLEAVGRMGAAAPQVVLVETAAEFVGDGFQFSPAIGDATAIDSGANWDFLVRDVEIHASQFTAAQVDSLRNIGVAQRRVYIRSAPPPDADTYTLQCR